MVIAFLTDASADAESPRYCEYRHKIRIYTNTTDGAKCLTPRIRHVGRWLHKEVSQHGMPVECRYIGD